MASSGLPVILHHAEKAIQGRGYLNLAQIAYHVVSPKKAQGHSPTPPQQ